MRELLLVSLLVLVGSCGSGPTETEESEAAHFRFTASGMISGQFAATTAAQLVAVSSAEASFVFGIGKPVGDGDTHIDVTFTAPHHWVPETYQFNTGLISTDARIVHEDVELNTRLGTGTLVIQSVTATHIRGTFEASYQVLGADSQPVGTVTLANGSFAMAFRQPGSN